MIPFILCTAAGAFKSPFFLFFGSVLGFTAFSPDERWISLRI